MGDYKAMADLVIKAQGGDAQAQSDLLEAVQERTFYFCKKMLKADQDAEDATQDVLITVLTKLSTLKDPMTFMSWLRMICANRCRNKLSRAPMEQLFPEDDEGNSMLEDLADFDTAVVPQEVMEDEATRAIIRSIVDSLPPAQLECVLLYYYDEMPVKDIAQSLAISENTVKSRLNYGRKAIKKGIEDAEKRDGIRLHGIAPLALLRSFFQSDAKASAAERPHAAPDLRKALETGRAADSPGSAAMAANNVVADSSAVTHTAVAATVAAGAAKGISIKVVAAILAGVLALGGGVAIAFQVSQSQKLPVTSTPVSSVVGDVSPSPIPTNSPEPAPTSTPTPTPSPSPTPSPPPVPVQLGRSDAEEILLKLENIPFNYDWRNAGLPYYQENYYWICENLLQSILCAHSIYPFIEFQDKGVSFETFLYEYPSDKVEWVLENVFNCSKEDVSSLRTNLDIHESGSGVLSAHYSYKDGCYYFESPYVAFGIHRGIKESVSQVEKCGNYYHITLERYRWDVDYPDERVGDKYVVATKKEADGIPYWSFYYIGDDPFSAWESLPLIESSDSNPKTSLIDTLFEDDYVQAVTLLDSNSFYKKTLGGDFVENPLYSWFYGEEDYSGTGSLEKVGNDQLHFILDGKYSKLKGRIVKNGYGHMNLVLRIYGDNQLLQEMEYSLNQEYAKYIQSDDNGIEPQIHEIELDVSNINELRMELVKINPGESDNGGFFADTLLSNCYLN